MAGGRFLLERRAGVGGMGVVFLARDLADDSPAAVKVVVGSAAELDRFAREVVEGAKADTPLTHVEFLARCRKLRGEGFAPLRVQVERRQVEREPVLLRGKCDDL